MVKLNLSDDQVNLIIRALKNEGMEKLYKAHSIDDMADLEGDVDEEAVDFYVKVFADCYKLIKTIERQKKAKKIPFLGKKAVKKIC